MKAFDSLDVHVDINLLGSKNPPNIRFKKNSVEIIYLTTVSLKVYSIDINLNKHSHSLSHVMMTIVFSLSHFIIQYAKLVLSSYQLLPKIGLNMYEN